MGDNPSCLQSVRRPVEHVSWDDVQHFLVRLNALLPGPEPSLYRQRRSGSMRAGRVHRRLDMSRT